MKKHTEKKLMLLILGFSFGFSILSNTNFSNYQGNNYENLESDNKHNLERAGYWNLTGTPILIDGTNPNKNWSYTASNYDWCSGSGSKEDPYVIENVTIDGQDATAICISYTDAHFIIRNCTIFNSGSGSDIYGIYLFFGKNGKIINNTISDYYGGIYMAPSINNTIVRNKLMYNEEYALRVSGSSHNISYNTIINNTMNGIYLGSITDSYIYNNNIQESRYGMYLNYVQNNEIFKNTILNNDWGIKFDSALLVNSNNEIYNNSIINSDYGLSIYTEDADQPIENNIIKQNIIKDSGRGIYIYDLWQLFDYNTIFLNKFINNAFNAEETYQIINGRTVYWDNGSIGNYWDDYDGVDANDDGIGDSPYYIYYANRSKDNYPIWDDGDDFAPSIIINSPSMNDAFGLNAPNFDITINDDSPINTTWYTIDSGTTNYTFSGLTGIVNQTAWDNKGTEIMTLRFYANDSVGHVGFKDVVIWKDLFAPRITINSPAPYQLCGVGAPTFSLTIDEPNIQTKLYSINGRPNITFTTQTQFSQSEWNTAGNGTVSIIFYVIDKVGNTNSSEVIVRKDAYIPEITIHSPEQDEMFGSTPPEFNISIIEEDLVFMWYIIEGNITQYPFTELTGTISQEAWEKVIEGDVTITFYAQDRAGNIGIESVVVIKSIPSQPAIPGYNVFVLLGVLSVAIIIIVKKWRNLRC